MLSTRFYGGSASSNANPNTLTTSGASSPITEGNGSSATGGSIALGSGAKYQESGSVDLSQSNLSTNVSAGSGSTVNLQDTALDSALGGVIQSLSSGGSIPVSLSGGNTLGTDVIPITTSQPSTSSGSFLANINWTLVAIVGAGLIAAVAIVFLIFEERK